ncbi:MAG: ShlB/FhaC/HecB family hemolysin secretion/activation protein, partial [Gammaproteobacteria bacterium]|nr:ShlB/FhaC/HecB family hemolysin secretion/activation protein [Gammaproteobacteria bacterium]
MTKRIATCLLLTLSTPLLAQTPPSDAGALRQQIETRLPTDTIPPLQRPPATPLPPEQPAKPGVTLTVQQFEFAGNTLISSVELAALLTAYLNRPLNFTQLQEATALVSEHYRQAGWLVRVYLPRQEIDRGRVTLQIVEGRFGALQLEGESQRLLPTIISEFITQQQPVGAPLSTHALDRGMLLLDDLPGLAISGNLAPGAQPGESDLLLKLTDEPLLQSEVGLDNYGARSTGSPRLTANGWLNSPTQRGDQLIGNFVHNQGSDYLRLGYTHPLAAQGLRLGMNGSYMQYEVLEKSKAETLKGQVIEGDSNSFGLE